MFFICDHKYIYKFVSEFHEVSEVKRLWRCFSFSENLNQINGKGAFFFHNMYAF